MDDFMDGETHKQSLVFAKCHRYVFPASGVWFVIKTDAWFVMYPDL